PGAALRPAPGPPLRQGEPLPGRLRRPPGPAPRWRGAQDRAAAPRAEPGGVGLLLRRLLRVALCRPSVLALHGADPPPPCRLGAGHLALGHTRRLPGHRSRPGAPPGGPRSRCARRRRPEPWHGP